MKYTLILYFLLFVFYSFVGWCMEVIVTLCTTKKLVNRGFLIGPLCPIYGFGCLLIITLLHKYLNDPIILFVMAVVLCSILEYFTSYLMEKLFKARWWDYSNKKFNVNGRICLDNLVAFGALGLLVMYVINPFITNLIGNFSFNLLKIVSLVLLVILLVDMTVSFKVISSFKNVAKSVKKDSTEEITKKVRELLIVKGGLYKRLVSAFNFEASEKLLRERITKVTKKIKTGVDKAKQKIDVEKAKKKEQAEKIKLEYRIKQEKLKEMLRLNKEKKKSELKKIK